MRLLLLVYLIVAACSNSAQAAPPSCDPWSLKAAGLEYSVQPSVPRFFLTDGPDHSFVITWYCDRTYNWSLITLVGFKDQLDADWQSKLKQMSVDRTFFDLTWNASVTCPNNDRTSPGCERYIPLDAIATQQAKASKPVDIYWGVRDNPTGSSRPCYPLNANGTRNPTAVPTTTCRVPDADDPATTAIRENWCTCTRRHIEETGGVYCDVGNLWNVGTAAAGDVTPFDLYVALCERKN